MPVMSTAMSAVTLEKEKSRLENDKFFKILVGILKLEMKCGHLKWKISDLSRITRTARPLIYYYFGKSKEKMVDQAVQTVSAEMFGFDQEKLELWNSKKYAEALMFSKWTLRQHPEIYEFFFYWRNRPDHEIGQFLKKLENRYLGKIKTTFPHLTPVRLKLLMSCVYGFVLTENGGEEEAQELFRIITRPLFTDTESSEFE